MKLLLGVSTLAALAVGAGAMLLTREPSTWERVRANGIVRIGYAVEPPLAWRTPDGRVTGESPEVARHVFRALGVDSVEWVWTPFRNLMLELRSGRVDVIAAGTYITEARAREVRFTRPTLRVPTALLVRSRDTSQIRSIEDLRRRKGTLAVMAGAVEQQLAAHEGLSAAHVLIVPDPPTGLAAVRSGRADALALSLVSLQAMRRQAKDSLALAIVPIAAPGTPTDLMGTGYPALAVRLEDTELAALLDRQLGLWLGTDDHLRTIAPFGLDRRFLPAGPPP